jgi:hypothetical protein
VAVSVVRCCGEAWIDCACTPSKGRVPGRTSRGLGVLAAVWLLVLGFQVEPAQAADAPQPPALPPVPTIAVDVNVSVPSISVNVQVGTVAVSVSTAPVDVSVSTSTSGAVSSTDVAAAPPPPPTPVGSDHCCEPAAPEVSPAHTAARARRPARAPPPERHGRPPTRAVAKRVRTHMIRTPRVERTPTRSLTATKVSRPVPERPAIRPKARACCERAQPSVGVLALGHASSHHGMRLALDRHTRTAAPRAAPSEERATDNRLLLQLGVLLGFLYLVCLAGWYAASRPRRRRA